MRRLRPLGLGGAVLACFCLTLVSGSATATPAQKKSGRARVTVPAVREALTLDPGSPVNHDTEVMALASQAGRLYAATDQWEYDDPAAAGQVLVKGARSSPWRVLQESETGRVEALRSFAVPRERARKSGPRHSLLLTQAVVGSQSRIEWLRDRARSFTAGNSYVLESPSAKVRAFGAHSADGKWAVYAGVTPTGILRGAWSPRKRTLRFDPTPELTAAPPGSPGQKTQKVTGFADCGGALYVSINTRLFRRNDGKLPPGDSRWVQVYDEGSVGALNSGLRGLSCVAHRGGPALLVSSEGSGDVYRFDHLPRGQIRVAGNADNPGQLPGGLSPVLEFAPSPAISQMLAGQGTALPQSGPGSIDYVIAAYNDFASIPVGGATRQLFGFEWHYSGGCPATRTCTPSGWDAAACFVVRTDRRRLPSFALRCLTGPDFTPSARATTPVRSGQAFVSIRSIAASPFGDGRIYYGGYDADFYPADGTAWVGASPGQVLRPPPPPTSFSWVKDTTTDLDIWLPDGNSDYYLGGFGTANGARTVITGEVPDARYWSFTAYSLGGSGSVEAHDNRIVRKSRGRQKGRRDDRPRRYRLTIATSCVGVRGPCLPTSAVTQQGIAVLRLYVPADVYGAGTGRVDLPKISYTNSRGAPISLTEAAGSPVPQQVLDTYHGDHGALPAELTQPYLPAVPVPTPDNDPPPPVRISSGTGAFNNPDNTYEHVRFSTTLGNLVVSAQAPTYRADRFKPVNGLARRPGKPAQVRYWSLCVVLDNLHTGSCLRDEQIRLPKGSRQFTAIVSPTCPVAGYLNCLVAGPEPLQVSLSLRYLLPSPRFAPFAFQGPYGMTASYVGRPD